jgi:hypothetical protein
MILVITHTAERTTYDKSGRVLEEKGTVTVSHGIDTNTGSTVILPQEPWDYFRRLHCELYDGEWYLK